GLQIGPAGGVQPDDHVVQRLLPGRGGLALANRPTLESLHFLRDGDVHFVVVAVEIHWIARMPVQDGEKSHHYPFRRGLNRSDDVPTDRQNLSTSAIFLKTD